jgi:hypothetical protein
MRAEGLARSLIGTPPVQTLGIARAARIAARSLAIRMLGRAGEDLPRFIASRGG